MLQGIGLATEETKQRAVLWNQIESSLNRSLLGLFLEIAGCGIDFANISITEGGEEKEDRVEIDLRQMPIKATRKFGFRPFRLY